MPRPSDPQARARLLAAARKAFIERGLDRAKVEEITQAAGMSKGAFYLHFQSKEQAFTEILAEALGELGAIVAQGHADVEGHYERGLAHLVSHWLEQDIKVFDVIWKHRAIMALVLLEGGGSADYQHLTEMFVQRIEKQVETLIAFGMERGYYRADLDPPLSAKFISGGFDRLACQMLREKKKPDLRALVLHAHLFVIHALGTPELIALAERIHGSEHPVASVVPPAPLPPSPECTRRNDWPETSRGNAQTRTFAMQRPASSIMPPENPTTHSTDRPRKAPVVGVIGAAALSLALVGWIGVRVVSATGKKEAIAQQRTTDAAKNAAFAKAPPKVRVTTPASKTWAPVVELDGTLSAGQYAELGFKIGGRLSKLGGKVGDNVKAGALLGVLDANETNAQLRAAQAQIRAAEAQLALADDAERRTSSMVQSGSLSEASGVQSAQSKALAQAQADSAKAQAALVQVNLGNHRLTAPFTGTITRAPDGIGSVVAPGSVLFEINDLSSLKLKGTLSESDATLVRQGSKIEITTEQGTVVGQLTTVLGAVDPATRRVRVEATIDNKQEPKLRSGSFVKGKISAGEPIAVLALPHDVLRPGVQDEVLVVEGDKLAVRRVTYAIAADGSLLVRFGLSAGERVVRAPKPEFEPGQAVNVDQAEQSPAAVTEKSGGSQR